MTRKATGARYPRQIYTRVTDDIGAKLDALAERCRVDLSELLRWLAEDAAEGRWIPSHLSRLIDELKAAQEAAPPESSKGAGDPSRRR